jgi:hypothetical protein
MNTLHQCYFSLEKVPKPKSDPKFSRKGVTLVIPMPGKKVPECCSGLHRLEKELLERRSSAFHHKNTAAVHSL